LSSNTRFHDGNAANERQRRGLRARAARDHRPRPGERGAHRFRDVVAVEHGDEGDRPPALLQHEVEELQLRVVHHAELLGHRDLDRAFPSLAQRVAAGLQLLAARVAAGERAALVAQVLVQQRAGEAEGARIDRLAEQPFYFGRLIRIGRALHRRLAHHIVS
jgi:hypothetical protein